jgi:hypothetical protein
MGRKGLGDGEIGGEEWRYGIGGRSMEREGKVKGVKGDGHGFRKEGEGGLSAPPHGGNQEFMFRVLTFLFLPLLSSSPPLYPPSYHSLYPCALDVPHRVRRGPPRQRQR